MGMDSPFNENPSVFQSSLLVMGDVNCRRKTMALHTSRCLLSTVYNLPFIKMLFYDHDDHRLPHLFRP